MKPKLKVLFLAASPTDASRTSFGEELRKIRAKVRAAKHRDAVELLPHLAVQPGDLQMILLQEAPHVVHFSGHGSPEGELGMQAADGTAARVSTAALAGLLRILKDNIKVVVLNACYSEVQAQEAVKHLDFVVAMSSGVSEEGAVELAGAFYQGLAYGRSVAQAFELARNELELHGFVRDAAGIRLLVRDGANAQVPLF